MNVTQLKCFLFMAVLAIIGFGPLSFTCLIGLYVVMARPTWFYALVRNLYRRPGGTPAVSGGQPGKNSAGTRLKCFLSLLVLLVLDIAPVPVTGSIGLYVVLLRPAWFQAVVERMYGDLQGTRREWGTS